MILKPGILALIISSACIGVMVVHAAYFGLKILMKWDIRSGSEYQLILERKTYMISSIMAWFMAFELVSLFLFVYTANDLHTLFVGAMCAVGSLTADTFGYPVLLVKVVIFIASGLWLIVNIADNTGYDYPLIRVKYIMLEIIAPLVIAENILQWLYFSRLHPDIITSCCGSLFSLEGRGIAKEIAGAPAATMLRAFFGTLALTCITGIVRFFTGKLGCVFGILSGAAGIVSLVGIISAISIYIYELPTHHCPFCILDAHYHYIGYAIYILLLVGTITGIGSGFLGGFGKIASLRESLPVTIRGCTAVAIAAFFALGVIAAIAVAGSHLQMNY